MGHYKRTLTAIGVFSIALTGLFGFGKPANAAIMCDFNIGDLVKTENSAHVYGVGADWKLHLFPSESIFFSWQPNFHGVQTMLPACVEEFGIGKPMPYRPGSTLVKTAFSPTIYMVEPGAILRAIDSEEALQSLFGSDWNRHVTTISEPEFLLYTLNTTESPLTFGEGTLLKPYGDIFVYAVQYGNIFRVDGQLPTHLADRVQAVPLSTFNEYVASRSLLGEASSAFPTISVNQLVANEFERTTAIQLPREQLRVNNSFRAKLMAKTIQDELFIRMTPTIVGEATASDLTEMTILVKSMSDMRTCSNEKNAVTMNAELWMGSIETPIAISFEMRIFEDPMSIYFNIHELDLTTLELIEETPAHLQTILEGVTHKWIKLDMEALSTLGETDLEALMPSCAEKAELNRGAADMLANSNLLVVTENFGIDTVEGEEFYHYGFSVNPHSIKHLVAAFAANANTPLSATELLELDEVFDDLGDQVETRNGELWIGKEDGIIHALAFDIVVRDEDGNQSAYTTITYEITDMGGDVSIEAPTEAVDAFELFMTLLMDSYAVDPETMVDEDMTGFEIESLTTSQQ